MRFAFGRARRRKTVDAVEVGALAGAPAEPVVVPEATEAPAVTAVEPEPAGGAKDPGADTDTAGSPPADRFDRALERLRTEIPETGEDASR
jgi:hypothetical protein